MNYHTVGSLLAAFCVKVFFFVLVVSHVCLAQSFPSLVNESQDRDEERLWIDSWSRSPAAQAELARSTKINFDVSSSKSALIKYLLAHLIWMWINGQSVSSCPLHLSNCRDLAERPPQHLPSLVCWISSFTVRLFTRVTPDFYPPVADPQPATNVKNTHLFCLSMVWTYSMWCYDVRDALATRLEARQRWSGLKNLN